MMERFLLDLNMERLWQRDYANYTEAKADIADSIVGFYNASGCTPRWDTSHPTTTSRSRRWQLTDLERPLSECPKKLDHGKSL